MVSLWLVVLTRCCSQTTTCFPFISAFSTLIMRLILYLITWCANLKITTCSANEHKSKVPIYNFVAILQERSYPELIKIHMYFHSFQVSFSTSMEKAGVSYVDLPSRPLETLVWVKRLLRRRSRWRWTLWRQSYVTCRDSPSLSLLPCRKSLPMWSLALCLAEGTQTSFAAISL